MTEVSYVFLNAYLLGVAVCIAIIALAATTALKGLLGWIIDKVDRRVGYARPKLLKEAEIYANIIKRRLKQAGKRTGAIGIYVSPEETWLLLDWELTDETKDWLRNNVSELCMACQREVKLYKSEWSYWLKIVRPAVEEITA